jgi:hypothetical protein
MKVRKFFQSVTPVILMWMPSDTPVAFYTVEVRQESAVVRTLYPTNSFLMMDDLMQGVPPGSYHITMTGGTVAFTNWIAWPLTESEILPPRRPEGILIK